MVQLGDRVAEEGTMRRAATGEAFVSGAIASDPIVVPSATTRQPVDGQCFRWCLAGSEDGGGLVADIDLYMTLADHHGTAGSAS